MAFGSRTAAQYDVGFNVLLGPFRAQLGEAEGVYGRTLGQMSTESLRLATKQADLAKAIETYGAESTQAARKTIVLREEMQRLAVAQNESAVASERANKGLLSQERTAGRFARGGFVGSGVGRSGLLFGSGAFVGGLALVSGLKAALDAAKENEVAQGQLQVALNDSGIAWGRNKARVDAAIGSLIKATAFTQTDLTTALANNVRRFGDVNTALRATAIEADVARGKNISLADAQTIVQRAASGQARSLLSLGITFTKTTTNVDALKASTTHATAEQLANAKAADVQANSTRALDLIQQRFAGNSAKYLTTSAGKQALLNAELKRSEEIIGTALLPTFDKLVTRLADYLDKLNRTGRLQHDVNAVMHDAHDVFHLLETVIHDVDDVTGSFAHTLEILLALKLGVPGFVAGFVKGFTEVGAAATVAEGEIAAVGTEVDALAATGPLTIPIIFAVSVAGGALGLAALEKWAGGGLSKSFSQSGGGSTPPSQSNIDPNNPATWSADERAAFAAEYGPGTADYYHHHPAAEARAIKAGLAAEKGTAGAGSSHGGGGGLGPEHGDSRSTGPHKPPKPQLVLGLTEAQQTALLRAQGTPGTKDDLAALHAQLAVYDRLLTQKGLNAAQLNALLSARDSVLSQIDSIVASSASSTASIQKKAAAAAKKVEADRKKKAAAIAKALTGELGHRESVLKLAVEQAKLTSTTADDLKALSDLEAFYKKEAADPRLAQKLRDTFKSKEVAEQLALQKLTKAQQTDEAKNEQQFLSLVQTIVGSYAPNAFPKPDPQLHQILHETRQQNTHLKSLVKTQQFPATGYAHALAGAVAG